MGHGLRMTAMRSCAIATFCTVLVSLATARAQEAPIEVHADQVIHPISRYLTGACIEDVNHEIYGGLYSQMVFGESFQEPAPLPPIAGFRHLGGDWHVTDSIVRIHAADGPKLLSERPAFRDGVVGVEVQFADRKGGNA